MLIRKRVPSAVCQQADFDPGPGKSGDAVVPVELECLKKDRPGDIGGAPPDAPIAEQATPLGGRWTVEKLNILERYLDA